ncbi:7-carboxy-7-deazaguanine synthase QueE, partial [Halorhodospira neutriphila]
PGQRAAAAARWPGGGAPYAVCTGGEPALQLDGALVAALHEAGFELAVETNGTLALPAGVDWVCVSPKAGTELAVRRGAELKLIYPQPGAEPERFAELAFERFFLQPLDDPDYAAHRQAAVDYCLAHPQWSLSLQLHKALGIP